MTMRTVALALAMILGPSALTVSAQTKHYKAPKAPKMGKSKNALNKKALKKYQKSHNIPNRKAPKHPAAAHEKPPKPAKHKA